MQFANKFERSESQPSLGGRESATRRPSRKWAESAVFPAMLGLAVFLASPAQAVVIGFGGQQPVMALVNEPVTLTVEIDYAGSEMDSLFSYGVALLLIGATGVTPLGVDVPDSLDFNGVAGPGALTAIQPEFIGVKGTVDLSRSPLITYSGTVLAEFHFRFAEPGSYSVRLDFFNTLGPTEDVFVSGSGVAFDDSIEFESAIVYVEIPEPRLATLLLVAALCLLARRQARCPFKGPDPASACRKM